ncbi:nucleotidyl transferase AbiEii/AbiGii toxin family protein [Flavobacterium sedimenticola]|uniref:Nucleotidyl transferase AbiEii/AbiGii toxin family protein n=1 Tax=Flavobacterium sedimenticola TaxID=3043286 RepID=A0ABT6XSE9_9FLAO|nr:nucleotidyl transferase AbiEii/AbiGii toxin family protein [Flavobacterium sedimenticola]MDI9257943.1 nucleotidyl transferase AbiEii/AbiGii toxin family protein [Flavobacterium sedimenticola]
MLHYNTVDPQLKSILDTLMQADIFAEFRLIGGTALSLYRGHRMSVDIDLFTDSDYDTVDFDAIDTFLRETYPYVDTNNFTEIGFGKSYYIGESEDNSIKLDLFYTEPFIQEENVVDNIRMATEKEIIAMKLDVVSRSGRKKDFWDIHELKDDYTIEEMFSLHEQRYPHTHNRELLINNFTDFSEADDDFEPDCLRGKHWELIKLDIIEYIATL